MHKLVRRRIRIMVILKIKSTKPIFWCIMGVSIHWTGILDWTDIFFVFTHVVVGLIDSCWLKPSGNMKPII